MLRSARFWVGAAAGVVGAYALRLGRSSSGQVTIRPATPKRLRRDGWLGKGRTR